MDYFYITVKGDRNHLEKRFKAAYIGRKGEKTRVVKENI